MKYIKGIVITVIALTIVYLLTTTYVNRIEKIENGEITQVSESYMK